MSKYIITVLFEYGSLSMTRKFRARARGINYAKEQFHRYTHENYGNVDRSQEDEHIHKLSDAIGTGGVQLEQTLLSVEPANESDLRGLTRIQKV